MESIQGQVEKVRYHNSDNGFSILVVASGKVFSDVIVGHVPEIKEGDQIRAEGVWGSHPKFGDQFKANYIEVAPPSDEAGIIAFLSTMVKGIGESKAKLIVKKFGKNTIQILDSHPERLKEIPGIGESRSKDIASSWQANREMREVMIYLQKYGITPGYAVKIWKAYKERTKEVLRENPYIIADEIWGIGFKIADGIAMKLGIPKDSPLRIKAGVLYALNDAAEREGHVFLTNEQLYERAIKLLAIDDSVDINPYIQMLSEDKKIVVEGDAVYNRLFWTAEVSSVNNVKRIMAGAVVPMSVKAGAFIRHYESMNNISFSDDQIRAISMVASDTSGVSVITGLPGTGKTSVCKALVSMFEKTDLSYCLCAPTGKAAERLSDVTEREAKTIHRLLGFRGKFFEYNKDNPLPYNVVLADESSMVDLMLFWMLTDAISTGTRLVLIGDTAQLPSVGAGYVLGDIISSKYVPVVSLKKIFRQAEVSNIILNAHRVNAGEKVEFGGDFEFIGVETKNVPDVLKDIVPKLIDKYGEVCVLSPLHKGDAGVGRINEVLQDTLNPVNGQGCMERGFLKLREGDKVVQLKNNYDKDVFNGMTGMVTSIDSDNSKVYVKFSGKMVEYEYNETDELKLAYSLSVHKSQGSEFECVVLCLTAAHYIQLYRKLLYTGITRAKSKCIIVGEKKAVNMAIKNNMVKKRNTGVVARMSGFAAKC